MNSRHSLKNLKGRPGAATAPPRGGSSRARRGNALVLAAGILVLLVIIATAYVSRTQAEREVSAATQRAETRDAVAGVLAEDIAKQIADSLFVRAVDGFDPAFPADPHDPQTAPTGGGVADANYPRGPLQSNAVRYSFDNDPFFYNFAPYYVSPWTNWPDFATLDSIYPGDFPGYVPPNGDRVGNPGFGDTRWLRDSEPMRLVIFDPTPWFANSGDELVVYTHFLHLSNIARAENGWRICSDISDIGDLFNENGLPISDGYGLLVTELNFPVEQWLPMYWNQAANGYDYAPFNLDVLSPGALDDIRAGGNPSIITANPDLPPTSGGTNGFLFRWARWFFPPGVGPFGPDPGYPNAFRSDLIPANFLNLRDLDGDGFIHDFDDRPEDEFIRGTARHTVSRVLTDTDGDGFTDSFWFLAPTSSVAGTRTIVGVSIIDNAGKLNLNAASRGMLADVNLDQNGQHDIDEGFNPQGFVPTGALAGFIPRDVHTATVGHTPADLALVGRAGNPALGEPFENGTFAGSALETGPDSWIGTWRVGLFDNALHHEEKHNGDTWEWILDLGATGSAHPDSPFGALNATFWPGMWVLDATDSPDDSDPARRLNFLQQIGVRPTTISPQIGSGFFPDLLRTQQDRRHYWLNAGRKPFDPGWELTPFTLADEIELRMFHGNNYPWVLSRFERSMQDFWDGNNGSQLFRGSVTREESNEYLDQLVNFELVRDLRGKGTFFSSTRNDLLPPWLWWEPHEISGNLPLPTWINDLIIAFPADEDRIRANFFAQSRRKLDLRDGLSTAVDPAYWETFSRRGELSFHERLPYMLQLALIDFEGGGTYGSTQSETEKTAAGLAANLEAYRSGPREDAFGNVFRGDELQFPAVDDPQFLPPLSLPVTPADLANRAVLINQGAPTTSDRMLGLEQQPFILEAFIAHVYARANVNQPAFDNWAAALPPTSSGGSCAGSYGTDFIPTVADPECFDFQVPPGTPFVDSSSAQTTIAVVQIANPFTESDESGVPFDEQGIDLNDYAIRLFGQTLRIDSMDLPPDRRYLKPATEEKPRSAIFYLIEDAPAMPDELPYAVAETSATIQTSFKGRWKDFLDIVPAHGVFTDPFQLASDLYVDFNDANDRTIVIDVVHPNGTTPTPGYVNPWSPSRAAYDSYVAGGPEERAIEILKKVRYPNGRIEWVVVDRTGSVDASGGNVHDEFTRRVAELPQPPAVSGPADWSSGVFNGVRLVKPSETPPFDVCDRWVAWARMTRAWGYDINFDHVSPNLDHIGIQAHERAPRFVFGREFVSKADNAPPLPIVPQGLTDESDMYRSNLVAIGSPGFAPSDPDRPWFDKRHARYGDVAAPTLELRRKPFFFTMNPVYELDAPNPPVDIYPPFNDAATRYGYYFWYVDLSDPTQPEFFSQLFASTATIGPPGAGIPSKGLLETPTGAVLSDGAEPSDGNPVPFRNFFPHSLQMNQKDGDFEQVGELFNLWLHGHELGPDASFDTIPAASTDPLPDPQNIWDTKVTFVERMGQLVGTGPANPDDPGPRVNRLSFGPVIAAADPAQTDELNHAFPALPAGLRVLDAFVCDGPGRDAYITDFFSVPTPAHPLAVLGPALDIDGSVLDIEDYVEAEDRAFRNAQGFSGAGTPGLPNLNTATVEVLRSLPQGAAIVNELFRLRTQPTDVNARSEFIRSDNYLADALVHYRDCLAALEPVGTPPQQWEPTYAAIIPTLGPAPGLMEAMRSGYLPSGGAPAIPTGIRNELGEANPLVTVIDDLEDLRGERGFASIGEIALAVNQPNADVTAYPALPTAAPGSAEIYYPYRWRMDMLAHPDVEMFDPYSGGVPPPFGGPPWTQTPLNQPVSASLSVDTTKIFDSSVIEHSGSSPTGILPQGQMVPDRTAKDNEELNMLMAGMSNLVSTRSDMFTVYLKVRTFRQDPATGRWDATKKENILDDSRYVMLVDRSNVNTPGDQPRILYFEKVAK